jgi:hypothetical protein
MNTKSHNYGRELKSGILFVIFLSSLICISISSSAWAKTYTTSFTATENPISEHKKWINGGTVGLDWANVRTDGTKAYGTESGTGGYDDSTAVLTGNWKINQTVQATVYNAVQGGTGCCQEVELRLRSTITAHSNTGYEVLFSVNSSALYIQIVKWLGPLGSFAYLEWVDDGGSGANNYAHDGDIIKATITGATSSDAIIKVYQNGVQIGHAVDNNVGGVSPWISGNPGMGFYLDTNGSDETFGLSYFTATDKQ